MLGARQQEPPTTYLRTQRWWAAKSAIDSSNFPSGVVDGYTAWPCTEDLGPIEARATVSRPSRPPSSIQRPSWGAEQRHEPTGDSRQPVEAEPGSAFDQAQLESGGAISKRTEPVTFEARTPTNYVDQLECMLVGWPCRITDSLLTCENRRRGPSAYHTVVARWQEPPTASVRRTRRTWAA